MVSKSVLLGFLSSMALCGHLLAAGEETEVKLGHTVITSDSLTYDYKRSIAIFEKNVVVQDPEVRMESDRLNVQMAGTNAVRSVTATGNVRFWNGDKEGRCDKAIYVARTGEVLLHGNAQLIRGKDVVRGREITFSIYEDRVRVTPATMIIFSDGDSGVGGLGGAVRSPPRAGGAERRP